MFFNQRNKVLKEIVGYGIEFQIPSHLPPVNEKIKKSAKEIAERIVQLYCLIGLAEDEVDNLKIKEWLEEEWLFHKLDSEDKVFFEKNENQLTKNDRIKLSWYRESLYALAWAINIVKTLPSPQEEVELSGLFESMPPSVPTDKFCNNAKLRKGREIMYQLDLYYCLHWLIIEYGEKELKGSVKKDIVIERRHALEWLVSKNTWDEITLDT